MNTMTTFDTEEAIAQSMKAMRIRELNRGTPDEAVLNVLQSSKQPLGATRISEMIPHSRESVRHALDRLVASGQATRSREAGGNRKRFVFTAVSEAPGSGLVMSPDEAKVFAAMADGRDRTIDDLAHRVGKLANPLNLILRRLIASGAIRSRELKSVVIYRISTSEGGKE